MGLFGMFKKKDDFDDLIKDPVSSPMRDLPNSSANAFPGNMPADPLSSPMPGMPGDDTAMSDIDSGISPMNSSTSASQLPSFNEEEINSKYSSPSGFHMPRDSRLPQIREESPQNTERYDKRDIDIITSKLDGIKAQLDNINLRLEHLERKANEEETSRQRRYSW